MMLHRSLIETRCTEDMTLQWPVGKGTPGVPFLPELFSQRHPAIADWLFLRKLESG
jgi:hypothetical protein